MSDFEVILAFRAGERVQPSTPCYCCLCGRECDGNTTLTADPTTYNGDPVCNDGDGCKLDDQHWGLIPRS